jgi:hypothetical protein
MVRTEMAITAFAEPKKVNVSRILVNLSDIRDCTQLMIVISKVCNSSSTSVSANFQKIKIEKINIQKAYIINLCVDEVNCFSIIFTPL